MSGLKHREEYLDDNRQFIYVCNLTVEKSRLDSLRDAPFVTVIYKGVSCKDRNPNNDCKDFVHKSFWQRIRRLFK